MSMRIAMAASAAVVVLSAASADAKLVAGTWKGNDWDFRMNEIPSGCKQALTKEECSVHSMWHKFGRSEYYALGVPETVIDSSVPALANGEGRKSWADGDAYCKALGGHLLQVDGELEMQFAITLMENNRHGVWLDMNRDNALFPDYPAKQGFENWGGGAPIVWSNWAAGEPNSPRYDTTNGALVDTYVDQCAFQGMNQGDPSLWNDAHCDKKRRIICERPLANAFADDTCNGVEDPASCEGYYGAPCLDVQGMPGPAFDTCFVKCGSCMTTTTSFATTTTSFATTTTTAAPTTSTTGTTTTAAPTTSTTEAPATEALPELGACMQQPLSKGWYSMNTDPANLFTRLDGGDPMHCCYKYINKPRLSFGDAQAQCERVADTYPNRGAFSGLATAYMPEINDKLATVFLQHKSFDNCNNDEIACRNNANGQTTWLGGKATDGSKVTWTNPFFAAYNDEDYGINGTHPSTGVPYKFASDHSVNNGMFYDGEPSGLNMQKGNQGTDEDCLAQGGYRKRVNEFGFAGWNDAKCTSKKGYFCEYCIRQATTTTWAPTTTTTWAPTTTTTAEPTTTTTAEQTTTTTAKQTTTTTFATTTTSAEPTTTTTAEPTTTTTAEPDCSIFLCGADCGYVWSRGMPEYTDLCGWSKKYNACVENGRTTESEVNMGQCGTTSTTMKPASSEEKCGMSYCSNTCGYGQGNGDANNCMKMDGAGACIEDECGWSRKHDRCIVGGYTNDMEASSQLGPKCV